MLALRSFKFVYLFFFCSLCIAIGYFYSDFSRGLSYVGYPFLRAHQTTIDFFSYWKQRLNTVSRLQYQLEHERKKNNLLQAQNIRLIASLARAEQTADLNRYLRSFKKEGFVSKILAKSFQEKDHFFYVEGGTDQAIKKDMVVTYKNQIIGKIAAVYPWYSKVCLITDFRCKIAAFCPASKAQGIHEGTYNPEYTTLSYVSHLAKVKKGDWVLSSGEGLIFPHGYALGRIYEHTIDPDGLYQTIMVKPAYQLDQIDYCVINQPVH